MDTKKVFSSYIEGSWMLKEDRVDLTIADPGDTSKITSQYQFCSEEDVLKAIDSADNARFTWMDTPASKRAQYVYDFIDIWKQNIEEVAQITTKEMGKPLRESRMEAKRAVDEMTFWAGEALRLGDRTFPSTRENTEAYTIRQPIGPVAAITPWNFPILSPLRKVIPGLICGCPVVLKPAVQCPGPSVMMAEIFNQVGLPKEVFHLIIGAGRSVGGLLTGSNKIAGITFTGSTGVGMHIGEAAAKRNAKVQLEMGGKNAAVVADYADIDRAGKEIVAAAFTTSGQRCTAVSRVVVLENEQKALEEAITRHVKDLKVGYGLDEETVMGPVSSEDQFKTVKSYLDMVASEGVRVVAEGSVPKDREGFYIPPTVLADVKPGSKLALEEIFGPVLVIITAKDFDEALAVNNETSYGLTSAIFTDNMNYAHRFTIHSQAGMVHVNHGTSSEGHLPFGGVKLSGQGAFGIGDTSKDFFTVLKAVYRMYP